MKNFNIECEKCGSKNCHIWSKIDRDTSIKGQEIRCHKCGAREDLP
jgi:DNA-directed RNA polymerase subunit RPC12/RpoP